MFFASLLRGVYMIKDGHIVAFISNHPTSILPLRVLPVEVPGEIKKN